MPSSVDEVKEAQEAMDESGDMTDMMCLLSALARSESKENVKSALDSLKSFPEGGSSEQQGEKELLIILALFRLKMDDACIKACKNVRYPQNITFAKSIHEAIKNERESENQRNIAIGLGVGAAVLTGAALLFSFASRRRK